MSILVLNSGSSSLKFKLFDIASLKEIASGRAERIGMTEGTLVYYNGRNKTVINKDFPTHELALEEALSLFTDSQVGVMDSIRQISAVGHRVLHGADRFSESVLINENVVAAIEDCIPLGPLHNPANLMGITACMDELPCVPQVAVFDTAFHASIPDYAHTYPIPHELTKKYHIRKYGFHGTSHRYAALAAAQMCEDESLRLICCHLGNGSSVAAISAGRCIDTSMGLTPLDGLEMGTRSGSIDPSVIQYLCKAENLSLDEFLNILNTKSGLLGVSGVSSDYRHTEAAADGGNERALLALSIFNYRVRTTIGAYAAALEGVDGIIFTGGIGENSHRCRSAVLGGLEYLGAQLDEKLNEQPSSEKRFIQSASSKVKIMVIPADEELMIALDTFELTKDLITKR